MTDEIAENAEVAPDLLWGTFVRAEGGVLDWLDPDAPPHARALVRLWKQCGLMMSLGKRAWDELRPVLERAPVLQLINPPLDKAAAEGVIERHLHRCGARPRPVRWFPDARSARDYDAAAHYCARGVFPADASTPHAFTAAWLAGDLRPRHHHEWRLRGAGERREDRSVREIESPAHLLELFAAGVFYYWIGCDEVLCTARPSLWIVDGALHRADGPAVEWPTGERSFFWRGIEVPAWIIEHPERLTRERIGAEPKAELRRCMMERFGMERFSLLELWAEWRQCHDIQEFRPFVGARVQDAFRVVSRRITAYAEAAVGRLESSSGFQQPLIDKPAVAAAMRRFLSEWGEPERPLHWFADSGSARAYLRQKGPQLPRAAYWPRMRMAPVLTFAWYGEGPNTIARHNARWLEYLEDWQDWTISSARALDCDDPDEIEMRVRRMEHWAVAGGEPGREFPGLECEPAGFFDPAVQRWTPLIDAFEAGLFYYWIGAKEIVCIPRPALWIDAGRLHREDGPAVEWTSGERHYFWRGIKVPDAVIEQPDRISAEMIHAEANVEVRRCMIERFGYGRFLRQGSAQLVAEDGYGKLWQAQVDRRGRRDRVIVLEVTNGTREPDGSHRIYFLHVPPAMRSPHEAVAWTYGLSSEQYDIAERT